MPRHTLEHSLYPEQCKCDGPQDCVICGKRKRLDSKEQHFDTCGERCFKTLLRIQRTLERQSA